MISQNLNDYDLGGSFKFGNEIYTSCNINSNGFIYFDKINAFYSHNPFLNPDWKIIAPFAGNMMLTLEGIKVNISNNSFSVIFSCYSDQIIKSNILIFGVVLYLNEHPIRPNQIDFKYFSSDSRNDNFKNYFYIGYSDGITQKYIQNSDELEKMSYGGTNINSSNIFPKNNSEIRDITNLVPEKLLPNCVNSISRNVDIGGSFIYGGETFTSCNISSNGYIYFGNLDETLNIVANPFSNTTWKILCPFGGKLSTISEGIQTDLQNDVFCITFNCSSKPNSSLNILSFGIKIYLNEHQSSPNRVDFYYTSSLSRQMNFLGNYFIGCCDGRTQKTILNVDSMTLTYGQSCIQSKNIFPVPNCLVENITNIIPNTNVFLISRFSALEKNVDIGGFIKIKKNYYNSCTISTNGFIYFGLYEDAQLEQSSDRQSQNKIKKLKLREPNEDTSDPFKIKDWIIFAPFCGKLKTTSAGIIVTRDIINNKCSVTFNCYTSPYTVTSIVVFEIVIHFDTHPNSPNCIIFNYKFKEKLAIKQKYYVGYSNGITQERLINNNDLLLTEIENSTDPNNNTNNNANNNANIVSNDIFPPVGAEFIIAL